MISREITNASFQVDSLDGLRGVAALIVVFSHTSNNGWFFIPYLNMEGIGKSGVFLFFLLSSFLLTIPLLKKGSQIFSGKDISHYWQRRFFRIYPLYSFYLLTGLISTWFISTVFAKSNIGVPFSLDLSGFLGHIFLMEGKGVTWSIAVEFKFYFILPFSAYLLWKLSKVNAWLCFTILFFSILASQYYYPQSESLTNDTRLMPYIPIFLIGMGMAFLQTLINASGGLSSRHKILANYLGWVAMFIIVCMTPSVFSLIAWDIPKNFFHREFITYAVLWSFVLFSAVNGHGLLNKFLRHPVLRNYGMLSFSLYLFHPVFVNALKTLGVDTQFNAWIVLAGATMSAYVAFVLIESPCSKYKFDWCRIGSVMQLVKSGTKKN